jgi:heme oxygenase
MLSRHPTLADPSGMSFFYGYGEQNANMWEIFKQSMDQAVFRQKHAVIIETANQTFVRFENWVDNFQSGDLLKLT